MYTYPATDARRISTRLSIPPLANRKAAQAKIYTAKAATGKRAVISNQYQKANPPNPGDLPGYAGGVRCNMGMSCRKEQGDTMRRVYDGERAQVGYLEKSGTLFTIGPASGRDYGTAECRTMGMQVYRLITDCPPPTDSQGQNLPAEYVGKIVIDADGAILRIPTVARKAFAIYY